MNVREKKKGGMLILVLGMILREARTKNNLTLETLSKLTNISITELSNLENGNIKEPSSVFLYRLSNILNLDYNEILNYRYESYYRKQELINA